MKITAASIKRKLREVFDPELNISIVDLGLIYDIRINSKKQVKIIMTLTTPGCPLIDFIKNDIFDKLKELGLKEKDISIELTFEPPWSPEKMTPAGRKKIGL
ncbi:MAG: metal-sulfur cluster assembly factor [Microgenomates group bacterium]|nr:metal-sulfur cluster assembly factor [Microgenomates group bacterium]